MARAFSFSAAVLSRARMRLLARCACCGENLNDLVEHGHHVILTARRSPPSA